ncbi:hypothetical protein Ddye_013977 [Dipteronia dyeriana]|uniref:RNase H type-1 domain-containing protein n=1 Tax=Dipteronia dyeriana TaxID=168575 RepID=A0AAD9X738_9ROSI|nr:hypothetical protein Ddye_013977 [Dipteronia dyeriana]
MNSDAVIDVVKRKAGIGLIVRDCSGDVLASYVLSAMVGFSPAVAEAMAIRRGISFACEVSFPHYLHSSQPVCFKTSFSDKIQIKLWDFTI